MARRGARGAAVAALMLGWWAARGASATSAGTIEGQVALEAPDGTPRERREGVVVSVEGLPQASEARAPIRVRQIDKQFSPMLAVVVRGDTVDFTNDDSIFHNVFSISAAARFDLGLYRDGAKKSVTFKKAGIVDVYCNIHPQMTAKIIVVDSPRYAITDEAGRFRIGGVPAGTWTLALVHPSGAVERQAVTVTAGAVAKVSAPLREKPMRRKHLRKDGSAYGRYE
jgi:plastocyanin